MNYQLFQMQLEYDAMNRKADEVLQQLKERNLKIDKEMANFAKAQANQSTQQQGSTTQSDNGETQPDAPALTTQEIYAIAQNPQKWSQFLEARKPELEAVWTRRSA
jgi:regulatory protein YycI of two-component signal transduction system YycFG